MTSATLSYIALGSNMDSPVSQVCQAIDDINGLLETSVVKQSSLYRTKPMGDLPQADYINAVVAIETYLAPRILLSALLKIEKQHGRVRDEQKWQSRPLDLDILLYGNITYHSPELIIPHYGLKERAFVLVPLYEIAPDLQLPDGDLIRDCLTKIKYSDCVCRLD